MSVEVWEHLADQGWGSGLVRDNGKQSPPGFRLLYWTPEQGGATALAEMDGEFELEGGRTVAAPVHGGSRGMTLPHTTGRSSFMAGGGSTLDGSACSIKLGTSVSLEGSSGGARNYGPRTRLVDLMIRVRLRLCFFDQMGVSAAISNSLSKSIYSMTNTMCLD